jgi:hypothetical protein
VVVVGAKYNGEEGTLTTRPVDNSIVWLPGLGRAASMRWLTHELTKGEIIARRKKAAKVQTRAKQRRANSAKRSKARKVAKTAKRAVAKAKPKAAPVKKVARKAKQPVAPVVETVAAEVVEQPTSGAISVTEVEVTEIRKAS